jgi:uncharacterized protein YbjT (DUF2867 family)
MSIYHLLNVRITHVLEVAMNRTSRQPSRQPILVLGSSGKTGRRIVKRLKEQNLPVRLGSRIGQPPFDWENQATWEPALNGASAAYISFYPDLALPGAAESIGSFGQLALKNGVKRLVLLSGRGEPEAQRSETLLQQSAADWTILRASWFCQNFSESFLLEPILAGKVALPVGEIGEPFIDADDIADVATAALSDARHVGQVYELTGPRALTFEQAIDEIALASGREIAYQTISPQAFETDLRAQGLPAEIGALMLELFTEVLDGRNGHTGDGVRRALGREPREFREYARDAAATGVWNLGA